MGLGLVDFTLYLDPWGWKIKYQWILFGFFFSLLFKIFWKFCIWGSCFIPPPTSSPRIPFTFFVQFYLQKTSKDLTLLPRLLTTNFIFWLNDIAKTWNYIFFWSIKLIKNAFRTFLCWSTNTLDWNRCFFCINSTFVLDDQRFFCTQKIKGSWET